jgi:hypothetical protein
MYYTFRHCAASAQLVAECKFSKRTPLFAKTKLCSIDRSICQRRHAKSLANYHIMTDLDVEYHLWPLCGR